MRGKFVQYAPPFATLIGFNEARALCAGSYARSAGV